MSKKPRDFYHIQDRLCLGWRYTSGVGALSSHGIAALTQRIDSLSDKIELDTPNLSELINLMSQKISLLEKALDHQNDGRLLSAVEEQTSVEEVEVSLSSSGMGFFSEVIAEEDAHVEIDLTLETMGFDVRMGATVLESRLSADSEKPGYWVRVRFDRNQEQEVDHLLAHVTQRQIEKLQRKSDNNSDEQALA
jgi:hypothetical protein